MFALTCRICLQLLVQLFGAHNLDRNWNGEFQGLYDQPAFNPHEIREANAQKDKLFAEFKSFASAVAQALVDQLSKPRDQWIIQPLDQQMGIAGGEKFIVGQLFCKFARDDKGIYGSDELAIKMAKNEIRNTNAVLQIGVFQLHFSLMACHRVRGHAVITTALLPIDPRQSLVYGSNDGGKTVVLRNSEMTEMVNRVADQLGLLSHAVRGQPSDMKLSIGADCEGHVSAEDGRH